MYGVNPIIEIIYGREIVGIRDVKNENQPSNEMRLQRYGREIVGIKEIKRMTIGPQTI